MFEVWEEKPLPCCVWGTNKKAANEVSGHEVHDQFNSLFLVSVDIKETKPWTVSLVINKTRLVFKVYSGADVTCLQESDYKRLSPSLRLEQARLALTSPVGKVECIGQLVATTIFRQKNYSFPVIVLKNSKS